MRDLVRGRFRSLSRGRGTTRSVCRGWASLHRRRSTRPLRLILTFTTPTGGSGAAVGIARNEVGFLLVVVVVVVVEAVMVVVATSGSRSARRRCAGSWMTQSGPRASVAAPPSSGRRGTRIAMGMYEIDFVSKHVSTRCVHSHVVFNREFGIQFL